jgi:hypothetical protein
MHHGPHRPVEHEDSLAQQLVKYGVERGWLRGGHEAT